MHLLLLILSTLLASACTPLRTPYPMREEASTEVESEEPLDPEQPDESGEETGFEEPTELEDATKRQDAALDGSTKPLSDAGQSRRDGAVTIPRLDASLPAERG